MRQAGVWLWAGVLCGVLAAADDFKIGPDAPLDSLALASGSSGYLAVWRDLSTPAAPRIRAATISFTGVVSADFAVSDASGLPAASPVQLSTAAFDGANFLVVWGDSRAGGVGIRGALVTPAGVVVNGADFQIGATARSTALAPQVVFTGSDYLVAWQDDPMSGTGTQISFARVSKAGAAGASTLVSVPSVAAASQQLDFLAAGPSGETLILFEDLAVTPSVTRAVRVAADNTVQAPAEGAALFTNDFSSTGFGAPVGAAFDGTNYIILSSHSAQTDSSVFRTLLPPGGTLIRSSEPLAEAGQGTTGLAEDALPRTFYNGSQEFLFVRNIKVSESAYHLVTKRVTTAGADRDPNVSVIDSASRGVLNGAVAANLGTQYLVAWMDGRRGDPQPARQLNVYGLFIDGAQKGDESKPAIKAVARANPIIGNLPLKTGFGTSGSTGFVDSVRWDFGDGNSSTLGSVVHSYETQGTFTAVLSLIRAGYIVRDCVRIMAGVNSLGGGGGPAESSGGALGPVSAGVDTSTIISSAAVALNFAQSGSDSLRFAGYFDPALLPVTLADKKGSLTLAGKVYDFTLAANGTFVSAAGVKPVIRAGLNNYTGSFVVSVSSDDLVSTYAALGAVNDTLDKAGVNLTVPFSINFDQLSLTSALTANYTAKAGKAGRLYYLFGYQGYYGTGFLHVTQATAAENKAKEKSHTFAVAGNLGWGANKVLSKSDSGVWRISFGNYSEDIAVSSLTLTGDTLYYKPAVKNKSGITVFYYNTKTRMFGLQLKLIPAEGSDFSGMPLASSPVSRADMALGFDLDLSGGEKYQASIYVRYGRKKQSSKKWALR